MWQGGCAHPPHGSWARTRATANMRTHAPTHAHAQPRARAATHTRSHAHTHRRSHAHTQPRTDAATHTRAYVRAHGGYRYRYWYGAGSRRQPSAEDEGRPLRFSLLAFYPFWRTSPPSVERRNGNVYALRTPSAGCCMLSATYGRLQLVRCTFLVARCLLHVVSMHRCSSSQPFCLVRVMHSMIPAARCLQHVVCCTVSAARSLLHAVRCMLSVTRCLPHVVCHTLCAARCLLRVDAARCALHAVCCMVCAARFRPSHVSCIVSAVCCTLHAVFSCLPSVCVVRWMVRAGCCPLHECLLHVGCGSLQPASNVRLPLHRLPLSTVPRYALRSGTEWGMLHRTTAWGNASLRCASHAVRNRTTPRSTVAELSVAMVAGQPRLQAV